MSVAVEITNGKDREISDALAAAYESGQFRGNKLAAARPLSIMQEALLASANADLERRNENARNLFHRGGASIVFLGGVDGAQKLHDLVTDLGRGFVLNPVTHIVDFKIPHETRKAGAEFLERRIELTQAIRLARDVKGRLCDRCTLPGAGQIEIRFGGAVVIQSAVKSGSLEFSDVVSDVI